MSRRTLFLALALAACSSAAPPPEPQPAPVTELPPPPALPPSVEIAMPSDEDVAARELTADQQVRQAMDRLGYGPRPGEYDRVRAMGVDRWIALQLDPASIPDSAADRLLASYPTLSMSASALLAEYPPPAVQKRQVGALMLPSDSQAIKLSQMRSRRLLTDVQSAKVARALVSDRQLQEVMTDFWSDHFNVYAAKGPLRYYLAQYERSVIRPYALGNFRALLGAVAHSPAMLFYLDNWQSAANPDQPVLAAERVAEAGAPPPAGHPQRQGGQRGGAPAGIPGGAGYGSGAPPASRRGGAPAAQPQSAVRRGRGLNENFARELMELHTLGVDGGYSQEDVTNVARILTGWSIEKPEQVGVFVFRPQWHDAGSKTVLGQYFPAGHGMDEGERLLDMLASDPHTATHIATQLAIRFVADTPPPSVIEKAAAEFTRTHGDIRQTVRVIVQSPEFFSRAAYRAKVKSPFRLVVSALRAVDAAPDTSPRTAQLVARLGEPLYLHQAPNGYPLTGESWMNTGAIINRINFGLALAAGRVPGASLGRWPEGERLEREPHAAQVDGVIASILQGEASPDTRRILEQGTNPMLGTPVPDSVNRAESDSLAALAEVEASMMGLGVSAPPAPADATAMAGEPGDEPVPAPVPAVARGANGGGLKRSGLLRRPDPLAGPIDVAGLAQIVGLALGAPEFQRH